MKTIPPALRALLSTRVFNKHRLYQFSLVNGGSLLYTSADVDILWGGNRYASGNGGGLLFDTTNNRAKAHWKVGVEVDTLVFDILPGPNALVNGQPFFRAVVQGVFDGAELTVSNAYWPPQAYQSPVVPTGAVVVFVGRVAEIDGGRSVATVTVNSHLELLNQNMPRNLYQSGCLNTLFDSACTLNMASYAVTGTVAEGSTGSSLVASLPQPGGYFDLGRVVFTSGANAGVARSVRSYTQGSPGTLAMRSPFPVAPAVGDTFTAYPGCHKTTGDCAGRYGNRANFRGFPFIPSSSTAV